MAKKKETEQKFKPTRRVPEYTPSKRKSLNRKVISEKTGKVITQRCRPGDKKNGRFTEITEAKAKHYSSFNGLIYTEERIVEIADQMLAWFKKPANIYMKEFFLQNMIHTSRVTEWKRLNPYFAYMYDMCKQLQEIKLVKGGLTRKYDKSVVMFTLRVIADWVEKKDTGLTEDEMSAIREEAKRLMMEQM